MGSGRREKRREKRTPTQHVRAHLIQIGGEACVRVVVGGGGVGGMVVVIACRLNSAAAVASSEIYSV